MNISTFAILALIFFGIVLSVRKMLSDFKAGTCSCGCKGCSKCSACAAKKA
jgi:hypothetical protein